MKLQKKTHLEIQDPSGEIRRVVLTKTTDESIGNSSQCDIPLRDATLPHEVATIQKKGEEIWFNLKCPSHTAKLAGISFRESQIPPDIALELGESKITLRRAQFDSPLPSMPLHLPAWKTCSESGIKALWLAKKAANTPLSVYLTGETGTGKEVLAHLIHFWSDRASGPFIPIHCGALPESLAESELFGHVKGAFTGAHASRPGALMQAHNGTLFLDEIGDLSLDMQVKLLRFLENGELRPVGADHVSRSNVRILCATHKSLPELINEGKFRRDLYYRIASVTIEIPSLRSRPDDIGLLAREFAQHLGKEISTKALTRLQSHPWPGNVRELRHTIERVCALAGPFVKLVDESEFDFSKWCEKNSAQTLPEEIQNTSAGIVRISEMERILILKALRITRGNRGQAAKLLGVARSTLFEMLKRHEIRGPRATAYALMPTANAFH